MRLNPFFIPFSDSMRLSNAFKSYSPFSRRMVRFGRCADYSIKAIYIWNIAFLSISVFKTFKNNK